MAGLLWRDLPSGKKCEYLVYESPYGMIKHGSEGGISYKDIRALLKTGNADVLKSGLGEKLKIEGEALEVLTAQILTENANGRWDKPLDIEKK